MRKLASALAVFATIIGAAIPAQAAVISIVSMQYSAAHPVPHIHYEGGTSAGDVAALKRIYDAFVKCRLSCLGPSGASTAVLTMNGPGGDYAEGLALADFLRENHIATVVERGMKCYSACAFAFLGGSGYSSQESIGTYIDRMVEPGSIVGFHAPYADAESFVQALNDRGAMEIQGESRSSLALMVKELVKWNVDPEVIFYMMSMGPEQSYDLVAADDLYLTRTALPPTPTSSWITDIPSAVKNACLRLLAIDERADPLDLQDRFLSGFIQTIGKSEHFGTISGYKLGDRLLDIGNCSITDASAATDGDFEIALYMTPGIMGFNAPMLSFFNRQRGWSSAGTGGNPVKRILQKGPMNHYFLPVGIPIDDLDLPGEEKIDENRFNMRLSPLLATLPEEFSIDNMTSSSRVSHVDNIWVFERVGTAAVLQSAFLDEGLGRTLSVSEVGEFSFWREGTFDDTGAYFSTFGLEDAASGTATTAITMLIVNADGSPATPEDIARLQRLRCGIEFAGQRVPCN